MKFLDTQNLGGQPIFLDDLRYMQLGNLQAFQGILTSVIDTQEVVVLSGCIESTAGALTQISDGYVARNGVVFRVLSHTFDPSLAGVPVWEMYEEIDPAGLTSFQDGSTHEVYKERLFQVIMGSITAINPAYNGTKNYLQVLKENLPQDTWQNFNSQIVPPTQVLPGTYTIDCKKDLSGFVHLRGKRYFEDETGALNILFATLPLGYRPSVIKTFLVSTIGNSLTGAIGNCIITIDTNGQCRLRSAIGNGFAWLLNLEQVIPFEAQ
jgi:hypothetical protein